MNCGHVSRDQTRIITGRVLQVAFHYGHYANRFEFFHEWTQVRPRYSDHFGRVCCVVAFQASVSLRFRILFHEWLKFEPILGSFWSRMLRGCVPDSVSLRFEFSFHEWLKFRADTRIILVAYAAWLRSRSVSLRFEFSFMNGSSFELCSDHFGAAMLAVRQELESQVQQAR